MKEAKRLHKVALHYRSAGRSIRSSNRGNVSGSSVKDKAIPVQALRLRLPELQDNRHKKVVRLFSPIQQPPFTPGKYF